MKKAEKQNLTEDELITEAKMKAEESRRQELDDIITVLGTISGRRLMWRLMEKCKTFSSIWDPSAKIHYNAGKQDLGHFIMAEIIEANPKLFTKMMSEHSNEEI
jgi:hypothetical protein